MLNLVRRLFQKKLPSSQCLRATVLHHGTLRVSEALSEYVKTQNYFYNNTKTLLAFFIVLFFTSGAKAVAGRILGGLAESTAVAPNCNQ